MSWIEKLYKTYENNLVSIGDRNARVPLLPISHTIQNAHIEVVIDNGGNFLRAKIVEKTDASTIVPCTESSAGRAGSKPMPHSLCDKLQYVAGDFTAFGGDVTSGFAQHPEEPYEIYVKQLSDWCASQYKNVKVAAILVYVKKKQLINDLVAANVLPVDSYKKLLKKRPVEPTSSSNIFSVIPAGKSPEDAFVRWAVEVPGDPQSTVSTDSSVWKSWSDYYATVEASRGICYVTGELKPLASNHPKRIRHAKDNAKLISSNDTSGFTFRGRFITADQASGVSFEVTQKAHSALRWLIDRQGRLDDDQAVVAWAVSGVKIPDPFADTQTLFADAAGGNTIQTNDTAQEVGIKLAKLIDGYSVKLGSTDDVIVIGLDSATKGRMAIRFYRELTGSEFLDRIRSWHNIETGCTWRQRFSNEKTFIGSPALRDIAEAAYGVYREENGRRKIYVDEKLRNATVERLLPCIVDGDQIPRDIVDSCVRKASNKRGVEPWDWGTQVWEKRLGIACALYKHQYKERRYSMTLERERKTRDYLYGRLLALADRMESVALNVAGEKRETNAAKMMQRFAERPYSTWIIIETALTPYKVRLRSKRPGFLHNVEKEIDEVMASFNVDDYTSDWRLSGEFLLAYHCQRYEFTSKSTSDSSDEDDNE